MVKSTNSTKSNSVQTINKGGNEMTIKSMFLTNATMKKFNKTSSIVVSKSNYQEVLNDKDLQGYNIVCASNLDTNITSKYAIEAIKTRNVIEGIKISEGVEVIRVGKGENIREYAFDYTNRKIALGIQYNKVEAKWELKWKQVRQYFVLQFVAGSKVQIEEYVDGKAVMGILAESLKACKATYQAENKINAIKDNLCVEVKGYGQVSIDVDIMGNPVEMNTPEWHWEQNKVNVITVDSDIKLGSGKLTKDTYALVNSSVNAGIPIITDKQATKYIVIGAGAEAMGVYKVNDNLVSFNPLSDINKGANRIASGNSKGAQFADASYSNLIFKLSNGARTATHGSIKQTMIALGLACVAQGEMITNAQEFNFSIDKKIVVEVNTISLGINPKASLKEVKEAIIDISSELIESGEVAKVITPGDEIKVAGTTIYKHNKEVVIALNGEADVRVGRCGFGGRPSTVKFVFSGVANMVKKNIKARGESVKATSVSTTRETFQVNGVDGVADTEWEVLLHSESFKTVHKLIAMFANDMALESKVVEYVNGELTIDGNIVSQSDFNAWILSKLESRVIRRLVCNEDIAEIKEYLTSGKAESLELNGETVALSGTVSLVETSNGFTWVEQEVAVIIGFSHFQVEVCTADEWYGKSKTGVIEQYIFGTFHKKLAKAFAEKSAKGAESLKYIKTTDEANKALADEGLVVYNLDVVDERRSFLSKIASACKAMNATNSGIKGMLQSLASDINKEGYHAIRLEFAFNNNVWCADIPVMGMIKFASFDEQGNPSNDFCEVNSAPDEEGVNTIEDAVSVVQNFIGLLGEIKHFSGGNHEIKDIFAHYQAHIRSWLSNAQTNKITSRLIKGQDIAHLKVVPSFTIGWTTHNYDDGTSASVPNLGFASDSPIWKMINQGDIVISSRMPFPTAVAFRAVVDETIDRTMVSISPVLMSQGNRGDFDGDGIYVLSPRKVCGATGIRMAELFNESLWSLGGYKKAVNKGASNPVANTVVDTFNGKKLAKKFLTLKVEQSIDNWAEGLAKVNTVYTQLVGMTYGWAFDATVKLFESGEELTEAKVMSVLERWLSYEEDTLGGYSEKGYEAVMNFKDKVDNYDPKKATVSNTGKSSAWAKAVANKGLKVVETNDFAVDCAYGLGIAKAVERGECSPNAADKLSLSALAIRRLTSKKQFGSDNFFAIANKFGAPTSKSVAIANLASTNPIKWTK